MNLNERVKYFQQLFDDLQSTTSMNEKRDYIAWIPTELLEDWKFILEVLAGKYKLGYTYYKTNYDVHHVLRDNLTIQELYNFLRTPMTTGDLSRDKIEFYVSPTMPYYKFLEPLVNRTLRLGIGPSLLPKGGLYPMLGEKYEGKLAPSKDGYVITEKLDGNRCIASYDGTKWNYVSRNGKPLKVKFDMTNIPTDRVYDGEILSPEQVELSRNIFKTVLHNADIPELPTAAIRADFNKTSGLINSKANNKNLVYNVFDIIDDTMPYIKRREFIDKLEPEGNDVRILPVLVSYADQNTLKTDIDKILNIVTSLGGEGLMINLCSVTYQHKRTNALLKYKEKETMDMIVHSTYPGTGKYEGLVGGIRCLCKMDNGNIVDVNVGSGLSDKQRYQWTDSKLIVGKIVEIEYFSLSQSKDTAGTKLYSMSFPRFKRVREDKTTTSEY